MQNLLQNLRYTFRTLRENLGLSFTILLTIALGIGANTAIFTLVYATLLAPSPYPQSGRLVNVWSQLQGHRNFASVGDFTDWKRKTSAFQDLNATSMNNIIVGTRDRPEYLAAQETTPGYYA